MTGKRCPVFLAAALILVLAAPLRVEAGGNKDKNDGSADSPPVLIHYRRTLRGAEQLPDNAEVLAYIEARVGFKIDMQTIPNENVLERMPLLLAGQQPMDSFDVLGFGASWVSLKEKGQIVPLNDLLNQYGKNILKVMPKEAWAPVTDAEGVIWALPRREQFPSGFIPTIRRDWVKKLGMEMPDTIVKLEQYWQGILDNDMNGNGDKNDEIPFTPLWGMWGIYQSLWPVFLGEFGNNYWDARQGKVLPLQAHPNYRLMIAKLAEWYKKGYLYKEFYSDSDERKAEFVQANRSGGGMSFFNGSDYTWRTVPEADVAAMRPLKDAPGKTAWGSNAIYTQAVMVTSWAKHPELIIKLFDWTFADPANAVTMIYGIEGKTWEWVDKPGTIRVLPGQAERYNQQYRILEQFIPGFFPQRVYNSDDRQGQQVTEYANDIKNWQFVENISGTIPYNLTGTPAEHFTNDGLTLLSETELKIIYGTLPLSAWDSAIQKYMQLEGNTLSEIWTKQYKTFKGIK